MYQCCTNFIIRTVDSIPVWYMDMMWRLCVRLSMMPALSKADPPVLLPRLSRAKEFQVNKAFRLLQLYLLGRNDTLIYFNFVDQL